MRELCHQNEPKYKTKKKDFLKNVFQKKKPKKKPKKKKVICSFVFLLTYSSIQIGKK